MQFSALNFTRLAVLLSAGGLLAGLGVSFLVTPQYKSNASLRLTDTSPLAGPHPNVAQLLLQEQQQVLSRTSLSGIMQDPRLDLYLMDRERKPLEDVIDGMKRDIRIAPLPGPSQPGYAAIDISFTYADRRKAQQTVQMLISKFVDANFNTQRIAPQVFGITTREQAMQVQIDSMQRRIEALEERLGVPPSVESIQAAAAPERSGVNIEVLDPPSLPVVPAFPNRGVFAAFGFGAGFLLAVLIAIFRRQPALSGPSPRTI